MLPKYFAASVRLPTDWMDVAELAWTFQGTDQRYASSQPALRAPGRGDLLRVSLRLHGFPLLSARITAASARTGLPCDVGSPGHLQLPASLRRVMAARFADFDSFQLAKYNKAKPSSETKAQRKAAQAAKVKARVESKTKPRRGRGGGGRGGSSGRSAGQHAAAQGNHGGESSESSDEDDDTPSAVRASNEDGIVLDDQVENGGAAADAAASPVNRDAFRCTLKFLIRVLHVRLGGLAPTHPPTPAPRTVFQSGSVW